MTIRRVGASEASNLKQFGYVYLDIRAPEEYAQGHPEGAVNVPFKLFGAGGAFKDNPKFLAFVEALYPKDTKLLVIGKIGSRSLQAAEILDQAGYQDLAELRPGVKGLVDAKGRYTENGWETMGLPTETETHGGSYRELRKKLPNLASIAPPAAAGQKAAPAKKADTGPIQRMGASEASKLQQFGYIYLDIRAPQEYAQGHPKGAVNVPFKLFGSSGGFKVNPKFLPFVEALYPKDTKLLIIGKIGKRSLDAAQALEKAGYKNLCELRPGVKGLVDAKGRYTENGWETMGLPMEKKTEGGSYQELRKKLPDLASVAPPAPAAKEAAPAKKADTGPIQRMGVSEASKLKKYGFVFLDIRAPQEYAQGHPKGAVNVPFKLFDSSGGFKDNSKFLPVVEALYPKDTKFLVIGKIGKRSMEAAKVLEKAGYKSLCELRPGYKGLVDSKGRYTEDGWETMGLPSEKQTEDGSYKELKDKAGC